MEFMSDLHDIRNSIIKIFEDVSDSFIYKGKVFNLRDSYNSFELSYVSKFLDWNNQKLNLISHRLTSDSLYKLNINKPFSDILPLWIIIESTQNYQFESFQEFEEFSKLYVENHITRVQFNKFIFDSFDNLNESEEKLIDILKNAQENKLDPVKQVLYYYFIQFYNQRRV